MVPLNSLSNEHINFNLWKWNFDRLSLINFSILSENWSHVSIIYVKIYEKILSGGLEVSFSIVQLIHVAYLGVRCALVLTSVTPLECTGNIYIQLWTRRRYFGCFFYLYYFHRSQHTDPTCLRNLLFGIKNFKLFFYPWLRLQIANKTIYYITPVRSIPLTWRLLGPAYMSDVVECH